MKKELENLLIFKKRINDSVNLDESLKNLIAIELFDFIKNEPDLEKTFSKHLNYFRNLVISKQFVEIQDKFFELINMILSLTTIDAVKKKKWNIKFNNFLDFEEKTELTVPKMYLALQDKDNYYRYIDDMRSIPRTSNEEISSQTPTWFIKNQYNAVLEVFNVLYQTIFIDDEKIRKQHEKLRADYNSLWYKFDEQIYRIPINLHVNVFDDFFFFCIAIHQRQGFEIWYRFQHDSYDNQFSLQEVKNMCSVVIEDLIYSLDKIDQLTLSNDKRENIKITLHYNATGDLWRVPKDKYCYSMIRGKERSKILLYFIDHQDGKFLETAVIANDLGKKTQYLRSEIGKINKYVKLRLDMELKLIESKQGGGYCLNENIKIIKQVG